MILLIKNYTLSIFFRVSPKNRNNRLDIDTESFIRNNLFVILWNDENPGNAREPIL